MSLQSQRDFTSRPAAAFAPDAFDSWDQDALREAMQRDRRGWRASGASKHGPDGLRDEQVALFQRHGALTIGDLATLTGRSEAAARRLIKSYSAKGMIERISLIDGIGIYALSAIPCGPNAEGGK